MAAKKLVQCPVWKVCPKCAIRKRTVKAFYPDKQNRTGYRTYCIACLTGGKKQTVDDKAPKAAKAPKAKAKAKRGAAADGMGENPIAAAAAQA